MKQLRNPQNHNAGQNEIEENEVQSIISNTERLQQIAETLGFDAIAESEPAIFVRDWLNQFMGFGEGQAGIAQKGNNGTGNLNTQGNALNSIVGPADSIIQSGGGAKDVLNAISESVNNKINQGGGKGNKKPKAIGGKGSDGSVQRGQKNNDKIKARAGKGLENIKQSDGQGSNATSKGANAPTVAPPTSNTAPPKTQNNGISPPNLKNGPGPEICSVYTHTTEVMFNDESVKVYFNARDSSWDDLTWDTKWTGSFIGEMKNEGPETWNSKEFNMVDLGAQAGDNFTVETTVRNSKGETDTRSVTYDVIGEEIAVWEVFFDSQSVNADGYGEPERIDPLIFDQNKDGNPFF